MDSCLYHSDKAAFDQVQKDLQSSKWIPKQYVHRLAMAVCSCRKFKGEVDSWKSLQIYSDYLYELLKNDSESRIPKSLHQQLSVCLSRIRSGDLEYSACRMVTILYNAKYNCFNLLKRENVSSNKMDKGLLANKKPAEKQRLTAAQIECIKRKKQKKYVSKLVKLDMFPGNKPRLEQTLTQNLFDFSKQNKCYIDFPRDLNNKSFESNLKVTYVNIWSKDMSSLNNVQYTLQRASLTAQSNMDSIRARRKNRGGFVGLRYDKNANWQEETLEKDVLSEDFAKKHFKERKSHSNSKKAVLVGGHCLQCLKPYTGLGDSSKCTYHPGYLDADGIWSCCSESYDLEYADLNYDLHSETGCTTTEQHMWRPHAKRSRTHEKTVNYIERQYARTRHIKHRYQRHRK